MLVAFSDFAGAVSVLLRDAWLFFPLREARTMHSMPSSRQLVQREPLLTTSQRTFLARHAWHAVEERCFTTRPVSLVELFRLRALGVVIPGSAVTVSAISRRNDDNAGPAVMVQSAQGCGRVWQCVEGDRDAR